jgi:hypothetical protein
MAKFQCEVPSELMNKFRDLENETKNMLGEMVNAGAETVYKNVQSNMKKSFDDTTPLEKGLRKTRIYETPSDDGINVKVAFYGYDSSKVTKKYPKGVPIPLMAIAREYGTSSGERKKPFFRKSFKKTEIEQAMLQVQENYIEGD